MEEMTDINVPAGFSIQRRAPEKVPHKKKERSKLFRETPEDELKHKYVWSLMAPSTTTFPPLTWFYYSIKTKNTNDRVRLEPVPEKWLKYLHKTFKKTEDYRKYGERHSVKYRTNFSGDESPVPSDSTGGFPFDHRIYIKKEGQRLSQENNDKEDRREEYPLGKREIEDSAVPTPVGWDVDPGNIEEATKNDPTFCEPKPLTPIKKSPQKKMAEFFDKMTEDTNPKTWPGNSDLEQLAKVVLECGGNTCLRSEYLISNPLTDIKEGKLSPNDGVENENENENEKGEGGDSVGPKKNGTSATKRKRSSSSSSSSVKEEEAVKPLPVLLSAVEEQKDGSVMYFTCALDLSYYDPKGPFPCLDIHLYGDLPSAHKKASQLHQEFLAQERTNAKAWVEEKWVMPSLTAREEVEEELIRKKRSKNDGENL